MHKYDPRQKNKEELAAAFVCGREILREVLESLAPGKKKELTNQSWIITGPRGAGKTHFITHLYHQIKDHKTLAKAWLPISVPEEIMGGGNLWVFMKAVTRHLRKEAEKSLDDGSLMEKIETLQREKPFGPKKEQEVRRGELEQEYFNIWLEIHRKTGKKIIFLLENIQDLMNFKLKTADLQRLRSFMHEHPQCFIIIGTALSVFHEILLPEEPFYQFFKLRSLEELSTEGIVDFLKREMRKRGRFDLLEKVDQSKAHINAFRILTGGNSRLALYLADILEESESLEIADIIKKATELTPYFKHETDSLSNAKQSVLEALSDDLPAMTVKEIAHYTGDSIQATSENLNRLVKEGKVKIINVEPGDGVKRSETFYSISDYFYRIWLQLRQGMIGEDHSEWMAELLTFIYEEESEGDWAASGKMKPVYDRAREKIAQPAYAERIEALKAFHAEKEKAKKEWKPEVKEAASILLKPDVSQEELEKALEIINKELKENPKEWVLWSALAYGLFRCGRPDETITAYREAVKIKPDYHQVWYNMGSALYNSGQPDEAIAAFREALRIKPDSHEAWYNMGIGLSKSGKLEEAMNAFLRYILLMAPVFRTVDMEAAKVIREAINKVRSVEEEVAALSSTEMEPKVRFKAAIHLLYLDKLDGIETLFAPLFKELGKNADIQKQAFFHFQFETIRRLTSREEKESNPAVTGKYWLRSARNLETLGMGEIRTMVMLFILHLLKIGGEGFSLDSMEGMLEEWKKEKVDVPEIIPRLLKAVKNPKSREAKVFKTDPLFAEILRLL